MSRGMAHISYLQEAQFTTWATAMREVSGKEEKNNRHFILIPCSQRGALLYLSRALLYC